MSRPLILETSQIARNAAGQVYSALTDYAAHEARARGAGAEVTRLGEGYRWHARFRLRGIPREIELTILEAVADTSLRVHVVSPNLDIVSHTRLVPIGPGRTEVVLRVEVGPRSLAARLMLQSARLAQARLARRMGRRLRRFLKTIPAG